MPHSRYVEPSRLDIQSRFSELGFDKPYSHDLVRDIANAVSHIENEGKIYDAFTNVMDTNSLSDFKSQEEYLKQVEYDLNVQKFISSLDFDKFSGNTPLAKAASVVAALSSQNGGEGEEGDGNPLPIFTDKSESGEKKAEKLQEDVEMTLEANRSLAKYLINPDEVSPEVALASMTKEQRSLISKLALLGDRGKIKAQRQSAKLVTTQMEEYSQVSRLQSFSQVLLPTFGYKMATKSLLVKQTEQSAKQSLFLLIDNSGSMRDTGKPEWVKAIVLDRLNAVAKGEAELFIAWFESSIDLNNVVRISNKKEALEFAKRGFYGNFNGNATNVEHAIKQVEEAVRLGSIGKYRLDVIKPQVVVMNDGQDYVDPAYKPSIVTNGFILGQDNDGMKAVCQASKGHYERFL